MAQRVFDTYHASEEEIEGIKNALKSANINCYETHKGFWGVGSAAIWINDDHQYSDARRIINLYQSEWAERARLNKPTHSINWYALPLAVIVIAIILYLNFSWLF